MIPQLLVFFASEVQKKSLFDRAEISEENRILGGIGSEELSLEKQCEAAIFHYTEICPGFQSIDVVASNITDVAALRQFCPCVSRSSRQEHAKLFHSMEQTCGSAYATSISYLSNIVCAMPESKMKYCGKKIIQINDVFATITKVFNQSKNRLSEQDKKKLQGHLNELCDPCFEEISAGLVRWLSEARASGTTQSPESSTGSSEVAILIGKLLDSRILCVRNDNSTQVKMGDQFCVPWLLGEILPLGKECMNIQENNEGKLKSQCLKNDQCVWYSGEACGSIVDHFTDTSTYAHLPPRSIQQSTGSNSCFLTVQNIVQQNKVILADAAIPGHPSKEIYKETLKAERALEAVSSYGWLGDLSGDSCLSRWRSYDFSKIKKSCSKKEIESFQSESVQCSERCLAAWRTLMDDFGCCYGTLRSLQKTLDPMNSILPNFGLMEKSCGKSSPKPCNAFAQNSENLSLIAKALRFSDIQGSNKEIIIDAIRKDVAAHLGVPIASIHKLHISHEDGGSCSRKSQNSEERYLQVHFSVSLSDNDRISRVTSMCHNNQSPVLLPTANYIVEKDMEIAKRMDVLLNQRSAPIKIKAQYLSYKRWVISLCLMIFLLALAIFIILIWRRRITFVWCWSCKYFMRKRTRRSKAAAKE